MKICNEKTNYQIRSVILPKTVLINMFNHTCNVYRYFLEETFDFLDALKHNPSAKYLNVEDNVIYLYYDKEGKNLTSNKTTNYLEIVYDADEMASHVLINTYIENEKIELLGFPFQKTIIKA